MKALLFLACCDELESSLRLGFLRIDPLYEEIAFIPLSLPEGTEIGNVLTGEKYDPKDYTFAYGISYCPFCGKNLRLPVEGIPKVLNLGSAKGPLP